MRLAFVFTKTNTIIMWIGTRKRDCIGRPYGTTVKPTDSSLYLFQSLLHRDRFYMLRKLYSY